MNKLKLIDTYRKQIKNLTQKAKIINEKQNKNPTDLVILISTLNHIDNLFILIAKMKGQKQ